jgi:hypothetical protein
MYYVNGLAKETRERIGFDPFGLDMTSLTREERESLALIPSMDEGCKIRTNPNRSGSAFAQMYEHGILAGLMRSHDGTIKALVVYTERQNDDNTYDHGFIPLSHFKLPRLTKKALEEILSKVD